MIEEGQHYKGFLGIIKITHVYNPTLVETCMYGKDGKLQDAPTHFKTDIIENDWTLIQPEDLKKELIKLNLRKDVGIVIMGQKTLTVKGNSIINISGKTT